MLFWLIFMPRQQAKKEAMGYFLDGKVSAVFGTHTHVQTADNKILPDGTGYITDLGMTGPEESVLGMNRFNVVKKFMTGMPQKVRDCGRKREDFAAVYLKLTRTAENARQRNAYIND